MSLNVQVFFKMNAFRVLASKVNKKLLSPSFIWKQNQILISYSKLIFFFGDPDQTWAWSATSHKFFFVKLFDTLGLIVKRLFVNRVSILASLLFAENSLSRPSWSSYAKPWDKLWSVWWRRGGRWRRQKELRLLLARIGLSDDYWFTHSKSHKL